MALPGWKYKKEITVDNSNNSNTLTDYQVLVENPIYNEAGLVGSWHFNEGSGTTAYDSSGKNNNGTINGATWTTGKFGSGLSFDGVNDYVSAPLVTTATNNVTMEAWVKWNGGTTTNQMIVLNGNSGSSGYDFFLNYSNSNHLYIHCGGVGFANSNTQLTVGVWQHIVGVRDAGTWKLYLNGSQLSLSGNPVPNTPNTGTFIGSNQGGTENFNGIIDEVRIYNRALSEAEIQALYKAKARLDYGDVRFTDESGSTQLSYWQEKDGKFWVKVPSIPASSTKTIYLYYGNPSATSQSSIANTFIREIDGVVGAWSLDEGTGTTAGDSSGNNNNGTLYNSPTWITAGKFNKALSFDGVDDYVSVFHNSTLSITGNITVSFWLYPSGWTTSTQGIIAKRPTDPYAEFGFNVGTYPGLQWYFATGSGWEVLSTTTLPSVNQWTLVTGIRQGTTMSLYYNENLITSKTFTTTPTSTTGAVIIGSTRAGFEPFRGIIDEVRIFNRALSSTEISDLYDNYGYSTPAYPGRVLVRKFSSPEPTTSVGAEMKNITGASFLFNLV